MPLSAPDKLVPFVEQCVTDAVELICVAGPMADEIEDQIDRLVVGDGSDTDRFIVTTAHPDEPLDRVISFAMVWSGDGASGEAPEIVHL